LEPTFSALNNTPLYGKVPNIGKSLLSGITRLLTVSFPKGFLHEGRFDNLHGTICVLLVVVPIIGHAPPN